MKKNLLAFIGVSVLVFVSAVNLAYADPIVEGVSFNTTLRSGNANREVQLLQAMLAADSTVYPSASFDGHFGPSTKSAVMRFQSNQGLKSDGVVGSDTAAKLMTVANGAEINIQGDAYYLYNNYPCIIPPTSYTMPSGWTRTNGSNEKIIPGCHTDRNDVVIDGTDVYTPVTWSINADNIGMNSATINWMTNEPAMAKVYYTTSSIVNTNSSSFSFDNRYTISHSLSVTGLLSSTTYYYVVESKDSSGNTNTSIQGSFTTTR